MRERGHFLIGYVRGEGRDRATLFPVVLNDLVPAGPVCRVIDAFVNGLEMAELASSARRRRQRVLDTQ